MLGMVRLLDNEPVMSASNPDIRRYRRNRQAEIDSASLYDWIADSERMRRRRPNAQRQAM